MLTANNVENIFPMTPMQQGMYFQYLMDTKSGKNLEHNLYRFYGKVSVATIEKAISHVISRHQALRAVFIEKQGQLLQVILKEVKIDFQFHDLSGGEVPQVRPRILDQLQSTPFVLTRDLALRIVLLQLGEQEYELAWTHHHILMDGWCMQIILGEFLQAYYCLATNSPVTLQQPRQLEYYVKWLSKQDRKQALQFWREYLADVHTTTLLGTYNEQPSKKGTTRYQSMIYDSKLSRAVSATSKRLNVTMNAVFQALWSVCLHAITKQDQVVFGAVVSGRPSDIPGIDKTIGLFMNTVPVKVNIDHKTELQELIQRAQTNYVNSLDHQYIALAEIQALANVSRGSLFNSIIIFQNFPIQSDSLLLTEALGIKIEVTRFESDSEYPLNLRIVTVENAIRMEIIYDTSCFGTQDIAYIASTMEILLSMCVGDVSQTVGSLLAAIPLQKIADVPEELPTQNQKRLSTIPALIQDKVRINPDAVALGSDGRHLSYRQLWTISARISTHIKEQWDLKPGNLVGILMEKSDNVVIAMLAVMMARCGYVPLDANYPQERLAYMAEDANLTGIITESQYMFATDFFAGNFLVLDLELKKRKVWPDDNEQILTTDVVEADVAYVIYTSGSTAKPKGVIIEHRQICNTLVWRINYYGLNQFNKCLQIPSISFDSSVEDIFSTLISGGTLVLSQQTLHVDASSLAQDIVRHQIHHILLVPSFYDVLLDELIGSDLALRFVVLAGEQIPSKLVNKHLHNFQGIKLFNEYGPTECAVCATATEITSADSIKIGKAIDGAVVLLADESLNTISSKKHGTILIGGNGVARGYLNNPELTHDKFIFHSQLLKRFYQTGDRGRLGENQELEFLGREDSQVKINGRRVDLFEIEAALQTHADVKTAVVTYDRLEGHSMLVAYYESAFNKPVDGLAEFLKEKLPIFMVPGHFVWMAGFKKTFNGKIDRKTLPSVTKTETDQFLARDLGLELARIKLIFQELLENQDVRPDDDFFKLGGHSISAIKLTSRLKKEFGGTISLNDVFDNPTPTKLAALIRGNAAKDPHSITAIEEQFYYDLSHAQKRLWILNEILENKALYNMSSFTHVDGDINLPALENALNILLQRHEILRARFIRVTGEPKQTVVDHIDVSQVLSVVEGTFDSDDDLELMSLLKAKANIEFDLENDPVFAVFVFKTLRNGTFLGFVIHHIVSDGWSNEILISEFRKYYSAFVNNNIVTFVKLPVQYKDYAAWHNELLRSAEAEKMRNYWSIKLGGEFPRCIPANPNKDTGNAYRGKHKVLEMSAEMQLNVDAFCKKNGISKFIFYLTSVKLLLFKTFKHNLTTVGTPIAGRDDHHLQEQVGLYLNYLVLKDEITAEQSLQHFLNQVHQTLREAIMYQQYPYDLLVENFWHDSDRTRNPFYDVLLVMSSNAVTASPAKELDGEAINIDTEHSKVDLIFFFDHQVNPAFEIAYNSATFDNTHIETMAAELIDIMSLILVSTESRIDQLVGSLQKNILSPSEYLSENF